MNIGELIHAIKKRLPPQMPESPIKFTAAFIYSKMIGIRSTLLEQKAKKKQFISPWNYQSIIVKMDQYKPVICDFTLPLNCIHIASVNSLPKILTNMNKPLIIEAMTLDNNKTLTLTDLRALKYLYANKYAKPSSNYYINEERLFTVSKVSSEYIKITAVFDNPLEAIIYNADCKKCISFKEQEFYLDKSLEPVLIDMVIAEIAGKQNPPQTQQQEERTQE